ncbi:MAG: hypothetical protein ACJAT7_002185 [Psychromonas sp.]|jgi:hypothetical protein
MNIPNVISLGQERQWLLPLSEEIASKEEHEHAIVLIQDLLK